MSVLSQEFSLYVLMYLVDMVHVCLIYHRKSALYLMYLVDKVCVSVLSQEALLFKENTARLSGAGRFFNSSFQVSACTVIGCGPWSRPITVLPAAGKARLILGCVRVAVAI